jgi:hypothetical protein
MLHIFFPEKLNVPLLKVLTTPHYKPGCVTLFEAVIKIFGSSFSLLFELSQWTYPVFKQKLWQIQFYFLSIVFIQKI